LGFKSVLDKDVSMYYLDKDNKDHKQLVLNFINELLRPKYNNIRFYCHNLGGYDIIFILKIIYMLNDTLTDKDEYKKYKVSLTLRDNRILKCVITRDSQDPKYRDKQDPKYRDKQSSKDKHSLILIDSYPILPKKLARVEFNVENLKTTFPYDFALEDNLFYKGSTPAIEYYNDITKEQYTDLYKVNWSFKDETLKYLEDDLLCLYQVMTSINKQIFIDFNTDLKDSLTISSLATRIFLNKYYNNDIPVINKASLYSDIKQAYYGGITEVYKPYGNNLYYYDVNSLYPYVAFQPMPGLNCTKLTFYEPIEDIDNLFGFFYCKIKTPSNDYLGLLPVRVAGGLNFPLGSWEGWYFSEELKFAKQNGNSITVLKGYNFSQQPRVFDDYIHDIYKLKANPVNKSQKSIAKSLLNNLLGRFGISLDKPLTEVVNESKFDTVSMIHRVMDYKHIAKDSIMVSYTEKLDSDVIKEHGLDFVKLLSKHKDKETQR
jgi:hypothetical protein